MKHHRNIILFFNLLSLGLVVKPSYQLKINVVHINDFHARYEETENDGSRCKQPPCIGGFSRMFTVIKNIFEENPDSILLSAGDNYQGTLYYNLYKHSITSTFLNYLPFDAITLGNHEFDDGIDGVVPFIKELNAPVVLSNVIDILEPTIQGIYNKSTVIERDGKKIGIIGLVIRSVPDLSKTEGLIFLDEIESVNAEAKRLVEEEGVFTNIVLSHSGYGLEKMIAKHFHPSIGLIVGGHSHSFLYTGDNPPGPQKVEGPYPTIVEGEFNNSILIVQAGCFSKYVGKLNVEYDDFGNILNWDGNPIFLDSTVPTDPDIDNEILKWKKGVDEKGAEVLGFSLVKLERDDCRAGECIIGNFVADAFVHSYTKNPPKGSWTSAAIAIMNTGGLRTSIANGNVTYNDMVTAQPFENTVDIGELSGQDLLDIFEFSAKPYFIGRPFVDINLLQVSGVHVVIDVSKKLGQRITSLQVRCATCMIPIYENVNLNKTYKVIIPSFLYNGGDGYKIIFQRLKNHEVGELDLDSFTTYLKNRNPMFVEVEGRITILGV